MNRIARVAPTPESWLQLAKAWDSLASKPDEELHHAIARARARCARLWAGCLEHDCIPIAVRAAWSKKRGVKRWTPDEYERTTRARIEALEESGSETHGSAVAMREAMVSSIGEAQSAWAALVNAMLDLHEDEFEDRHSRLYWLNQKQYPREYVRVCAAVCRLLAEPGRWEKGEAAENEAREYSGDDNSHTKPPALADGAEAIDEFDAAILEFLNRIPNLRRKVSDVLPEKGPQDRKAVGNRLRKLADRTPPLVNYPKGGRSGVAILPAGAEALKRATARTPR